MKISETLGEAALLEQLAEEAAELSQAALKLARYRRGENPVCRSEPELICSLEEELTDVLVAVSMLPYRPDKNIELAKRKRWEQRLEAMYAEKEGQQDG